jgi:opacity protein-like surface antigen
MKTIIAAAAVFAIAMPALAAAPSAPVEKKAVQKTAELIELANGESRTGAISARQNDSKSRDRNKGSITDGRSLFSGK